MSENNTEVLKNLKKYNKLENCICLECGYNGLMGVVRKQKPTLFNNIGLAIFLFFSLNGLYKLVFYNDSFQWQIQNFVEFFGCLVISIACFCNRKSILCCPNCGKILKVK